MATSRLNKVARKVASKVTGRKKIVSKKPLAGKITAKRSVATARRKAA